MNYMFKKDDRPFLVTKVWFWQMWLLIWCSYIFSIFEIMENIVQFDENCRLVMVGFGFIIKASSW